MPCKSTRLIPICGLQWLSAAVLLLSLSLAMIGVGHESGRIAGFVVMPVALLFLLYALWVYRWRAQMIRDKHPGPYDDDQYGPYVLVAALIITVVTLVIIVGIDWDSLTASSTTSTNSIEPSQSIRCKQVQFTGLSMLLFQPSGLMQHNGMFLVPSKNTVVEIPISGGVGQSTVYESFDFEDGVIVKDYEFLLAEDAAAIVQVNLTTKAIVATFSYKNFDKEGSFDAEGLAFVPDATLAATQLSPTLSGSHQFGGLFLMGTHDGNVYLLDLGNVNDTKSGVIKVGELNAQMLAEGLTGVDLGGRRIIKKVVTDTLFLLRDNSRQLSAWDFITGRKIGTWATPGNSTQWEGVLVMGTELSRLTVSLAKDSPPELWSFDFDAQSSSGFASC